MSEIPGFSRKELLILLAIGIVTPLVNERIEKVLSLLGLRFAPGDLSVRFVGGAVGNGFFGGLLILVFLGLGSFSRIIFVSSNGGIRADAQ